MSIQKKPKKVKLRAFVIENKDINKTNSGLMQMLTQKLIKTKLKDRKMLLNPDDQYHEEDLVSDYLIHEHKFVSGAILRIMDSSEVPNIPDNLFDKDKISISLLDEIGIDTSKIYKNHYYFLLGRDYLITNLPGTYTIASFQTYINWFLEKERGDLLFELTPLAVPHDDFTVKDLKNVTLRDPIVNGNGTNDFSKKKISSLSLDYVKDLLRDVNTISEVDLNKVVEAELLIKFKKPKSMTTDEYQKFAGAFMKPISDVDNVSFQTKKGGTIKGADMLKIKTVSIEVTETNKLSEPQLFQEMEKFLIELRDE